MITRQQLECARDVVYARMQPTPAYAWPLLGEALGCEAWVKHENHTPTGAFKVRGGLVYLQRLAEQGNRQLLVTATRGNHGQSVPYAAHEFGREVDVFVPRGNSREKNDAMRGWGARLHEHGRDFDEAREAAQNYALANDAHMVPSFHEWLVQGVATYADELFAAVAGLDRIYVPIGMGSGAAAVVGVRDLLGVRTQVIGVVSDRADAMALSLEQGRIVTTETALTFADGVATRVPHPQAFEVLQQGLSRVVRVSDDEIAEAMRLLYRTTHNVAEGAGAAATAAALQDAPDNIGARIAVILTGGNVDRDVFGQVLAGATPTIAI